MRKVQFVITALILLLFSASPAPAQENVAPPPQQQATTAKAVERVIASPPTFKIPRVDIAPKLEDYLDGKARQDEVKVTGFVQRDPQDGQPVTQETTAYLSYDDKNFYLIFVCKDDPSQVRAHMNKRENVDNDDLVGVLLDTYNDQRRAYLFGVNPLGIQLDGISAEGQDDDMSFDTLWHSDGKVTADGFVTWMSIPFKSLRFANADIQTWGIALIRHISRNDEDAFYPYVTRRIEGFTQQFAKMEGMEKISPGRNMQIIPYGFFARARFLDPAIPQLKTDNDIRAGVDAKMVLKDTITLDFTVNPDFSQVESDEPQVTINQRFENFFPEKRPFFLENSGYFQTPENLFFSRRIIDPQFGVRLTGKVKGWEVAGLAIDDRAAGQFFDEDDPLRNERAAVGVIRLQKPLRNQSSVGFIATSRDFAGSHNRVIGADTRIKLTRNLVFTGQVIESFTKLLNGEHLTDTAFNVSLNRSGRYFQNFFNYTDRGKEFRTQLGFVPRVNIRDVSNFMSYRWRPKTGLINAIGPNLFTGAIWDHDGKLLDWRVNLPLSIQFKGNTDIFIRRSEFAESFAGVRFREHSNDIDFETSFLKWLSFESSFNKGVGVNFFPGEGLPFRANSVSASAGLTFRPSSLTFEQVYIYDRLATRKDELPAGESKPAVIFNNHILRSKINYQFNRKLSLRTIIDYNAVLPNERLVELTRDKSLTADFLVTYFVNPGTAFYAGYTDGYQNLRIIPGASPTLRLTSSPTTSTGRQFFVKMSYLLRF